MVLGDVGKLLILHMYVLPWDYRTRTYNVQQTIRDFGPNQLGNALLPIILRAHIIIEKAYGEKCGQ